LIQKVANPVTVGAAGGLFAGLKLNDSISSGLKSAADSVGGFASKASSAEGVIGKMAPALEGTSSALKAGASVMAGPWGLAIDAGIGAVTGLVGVLINASHASDALTLSQQGLDQAVQSDNGSIGKNITSYVAAQAQTDGLAKSAQQAGVSLATWTQAVVGNKSAQDAVTAAVMKANQATDDQTAKAAQNATANSHAAQDLKGSEAASTAASAATNKLTDANQQLLSSMAAQHNQIVDAINKQQQYQSALNSLTNATDIFKASLDAQHTSEVASAQQSALTSTAAMNLGDNQVILSQKIYNSETAYSLAATAAQGYQTALTALNGSTMNLDNAQVTLAQQMLNAKTSFAQNKYSLDLNTQAGINNRQALNQAATAIQAMGVAQYQASGDIGKANGTIQTNIDKFLDATGATGKARDAIKQYLDQLAQIPANVTTNVNVNVRESVSSITDKLNDPRLRGSGGNVGAAASGGARGALTLVGEYGPELVTLPYGSSVTSNANLQSMGATGGGGSTVRVQLEWIGTNDDPMFQMLRKGIRVRGGNVQKVLGVN
jgi:hypothetical protein